MRNHVTLRLLCLAASWAPVASAPAAALEWNTLLEAASGPPYPSTGHVEFGLSGGLLLPAVQRSRIQIGLDNVLCDGSVRPAGLLGASTGRSGAAGPRGSLNVSVGTPVIEVADMGILIAAFGDGSVRQGTVMQDFHFNTGAFDLVFDVMPGDGSVHKHAWHGAIAPGQPFMFREGSAALLGDGSVRLLLGLTRLAGNQNLDAPVVTMNLSADLVPEPATALLLGLGAGLLRRRPREWRPGRAWRTGVAEDGNAS